MSKKVQLALVGAQPLPVYHGIAYSEAEYVFLLHSKDTKRVAENLSSVWSGVLYLIEVKEPFDYLYCKAMLKQLIAKHTDAQFSFNITGGTKIMSLAAYDMAKENGINSIYIDQNNTLTELNNNQQFILRNTIGLFVYFKLFGQLVKSTTKYESIDNALFELKNFLKKYYVDLKSLFKNFRDKKYTEQDTFVLKNKKHELAWRKHEQTVVVYSKSAGIEQQFQGWNIFNVVFRTGWFELDVAEMLAKWQHSESMYLNTVFERRHDKSDKNEIDIIVDTGIKMFFFECKTNVYDIKDIDKFRNVVRIFGGLAAKPILVTLFKPNKNIIEKCQDLNIEIFWIQGTSSSKFLKFLNKQFEIINPI